MKIVQKFLAVAILLTATGANANLVASTDGQTVYDTDLNVTWLANANLAATNKFGLNLTFNTSGSTTWDGASYGISAMNAANYLGYNNWRLPHGIMCDYGYSGCTSNELGHLFYDELGGAPHQSIVDTHNANYGLFQNIQLYYWSGSEPYVGSGTPFYTNFTNGYSGATNAYWPFSVWAVRDGQIPTVPVPTAAWLLGSGLLGLIGMARRKAVE